MIDVQRSWQAFTDIGHGVTMEGFWIEKLADDLDRYRRVVELTKPEVIVETGTRRGGSAGWFASLGVDVITVDIVATAQPASGVTYVQADSATDETLRRVAELVGSRRCMVSLDSDHHAGHVIAEVGQYTALVSRGCYLVVEDGIADLLDARSARIIGPRIPEQGGPLKAIMMTLVGHPDWQRAHEVEHQTPLSHDLAGWWRRG